MAPGWHCVFFLLLFHGRWGAAGGEGWQSRLGEMLCLYGWGAPLPLPPPASFPGCACDLFRGGSARRVFTLREGLPAAAEVGVVLMPQHRVGAGVEGVQLIFLARAAQRRKERRAALDGRGICWQEERRGGGAVAMSRSPVPAVVAARGNQACGR